MLVKSSVLVTLYLSTLVSRSEHWLVEMEIRKKILRYHLPGQVFTIKLVYNISKKIYRHIYSTVVENRTLILSAQNYILR